jgi:hypothetical protein
MKPSARILLVFSVLLFLGVTHASADTLAYTLTGPVSATWELPVNPTPDSFTSGFAFGVTPINLMINGVASSDTLNFFSLAGGGALAAFSNPMSPDFSLAGIQLYSGDESAPTMLVLNAVSLTNFPTGDPIWTLTSTPVSTTPTPEPSVIILLSLGCVALIGATLVSERSSRFQPSAS